MSKAWCTSGNHHTNQQMNIINNNNSINNNNNAMDSASGNNNNNVGQGGEHGSNSNTLMRTVLVHIAGNRATWEQLGVHGALWQVNPDRACCIFSDILPDVMDTTNNNILVDRLNRAVLKRITLLESNTNIDEIVAVHIDGIPPTEFTKNGEGATLFLTGEGRSTTTQELFSMSGNTELGMQWMRQFPRYTSENLESEGVMLLTGASYYFVHQDHPVIHFMKANEDQLGLFCIQEPSIEGVWVRVDVDAFIYTVRSLRETVLRNTPSTFNLNNLTVRITKPDAQRWLQICPQLVNSLIPNEIRESNDIDLISEARRLGVQRYLDRPVYVTLRLSIEYALPDATPAVPSAPSASQIAASISQPGVKLLPTSSSSIMINNNNNSKN